jgi:glycerol-1-phosphate dehydrogenase [NAD(P)+]
MPLLARMVATPLVVDVRHGAVKDLPEVLADQRISTSGRVAVAVGESGHDVAAELLPALRHADEFSIGDATMESATELADRIRVGSYDAVVAIGGGRVLDTAKFASTRIGLPMVAVATNLAHDGIASPVSILGAGPQRGSYGVALPIAVIIDLDVVRRSPRRYLVAGIGDVVSNVSALADWQLSHDVTNEPLDGLAVTLARSAAAGLVNRSDSVETDEFLVSLGEALVLSGIAMAVAGTSRPCSGACHEISHAIDRLFPEQAVSHGEQVGLGAAFATYLRGDEDVAIELATFLRHHGLPVIPDEMGLRDDQFAEAVLFAPRTRPGRYTILEHLDLDADAVADAVRDYVSSVGAEPTASVARRANRA